MPETEPLPYRLLDCGDRALTIELGRAVDPAVNEQVVALDRALGAAGLAGLLETVPTYRSLLVLYDPERLPRATLAAWIAGHWPPPAGADGGRRRWRVPVHYGGAHGADLDALAAGAGAEPAAGGGLPAGRGDPGPQSGLSPGLAHSRRPRPRGPPRRPSGPPPETPARHRPG
ncbi:carboxyltransferase domain-containing protein, partial [Methylobacterium symbioticum]|uniref:carboxyltransferase domain-containing protein n=1 Tax=Methylobacterium symbioticum TaxID=2584084 RepID=UPI001158B38B